MIGLDTNVLIRFLVQDDPKQAARASAYIQASVESGNVLFVNDVVLCETVWVLESAYDYRPPQIAEVLDDLLLAEDLSFENRDDARAALTAYRAGKGDFADYLIGAVNASYGCTETATFDRALVTAPGFKLP